MTAPEPAPEHLDPTILRPDPLPSVEKMRIRAASFRASRVYPGPIGELISRELLAWEEFGYRIGGSALAARLADHVLKLPGGTS